MEFISIILGPFLSLQKLLSANPVASAVWVPRREPGEQCPELPWGFECTREARYLQGDLLNREPWEDGEDGWLLSSKPRGKPGEPSALPPPPLPLTHRLLFSQARLCLKGQELGPLGLGGSLGPSLRPQLLLWVPPGAARGPAGQVRRRQGISSETPPSLQEGGATLRPSPAQALLSQGSWHGGPRSLPTGGPHTPIASSSLFTTTD